MEIKPEKVCRIIFAARRVLATEEIRGTYTDSESEEPRVDISLDDDRLEQESHRDHEHDPNYSQFKITVDNLTEDDQCELVALAWLGRGDASREEWRDLLDLAQDRRSDHLVEYLLNMPMLAEYLEDGLGEFGQNCEEFEDEHA